MRPAFAVLVAALSLTAGIARADAPLPVTPSGQHPLVLSEVEAHALRLRSGRTEDGKSDPSDGVQAPTDAAPGADDLLKLLPVDMRMGVDVTIDGAGPFHFLVDSGANRTILSRQLAAVLGLADGGVLRVHSVGGVVEAPSARIAELGFGKSTARGLVTPLLDQNDIGAAGILGIDVLANRTVVIDLKRHSMTIGPVGGRAPASHDPDEIVVTARSRLGQLVLADADIHGRHIYAIVDSGTDTTIGNMALRARLARRQPDSLSRATQLIDVAGNIVPIQYAMLDGVRIGTMTVNHLPIAFADAHAFRQFGLIDSPAMLLGMDLLRGFGRVSIDFAHRQVRFLPRDDGVPTLRFQG